jgi:UDP-glucose 4-epimerase
MNKTCLVTGGLGYIGSHICIELLNAGYDLIIIDNLSNSKIEKLDVIKNYSALNGLNNKIHFYQTDITNYEQLNENIRTYYSQTNNENQIDIVIHLAGLKSVNESLIDPLKYYETNLHLILNVVKLMNQYLIKNLIFSSSATVYGSVKPPYFESSLTGFGISNPYGRSKFIQEEMLKDISKANRNLNIIILRYFNPIGHLNNDLKEDPNNIPNNLFPYIVKVANGELSKLTIYGSDYDTKDGTCIRDFIHVVDLANAHKVCSDSILENKISGLKIYNVGTGKGTSVLELINAFEKINNHKLNYEFGKRRNGDLESSYSNVDLIFNDLGWKSKHNIKDCVKL